MGIADIQAWTRRRVWWLAAALAVCVAAGYFVPGMLWGPRVQVYTAVRRDIVQTVVASGRIETRFRVDIAPQITGVVADVPVAEGQAVKAGQVLVVLDDGEAGANVEQAAAAVGQAEAKLRQSREMARPVAEEALAQARATVVNARQTFERTEELFAKGVVARAQHEEARKSLDVATAQARSAELQARNARAGGSDEMMAEAALRQAQAALRTARVRLDYTVIRAPREGTLIDRSVERGDVAQPGKALMVLAPAGETQIALQIDEKNLGLIAPGQMARASAEAFPKLGFAAEISYINPSVDALRGAVAIRLRVPSPPTYLRQDMTVSVDIEVARRVGVVVVPADAVRDIVLAAPWVMVVVDGRAIRRPIKAGARSVANVEVVEGLSAGDDVVPATRGDVVAGRRVRALRGE